MGHSASQVTPWPIIVLSIALAATAVVAAIMLFRRASTDRSGTSTRARGFLPLAGFVFALFVIIEVTVGTGDYGWSWLILTTLFVLFGCLSPRQAKAVSEFFHGSDAARRSRDSRSRQGDRRPDDTQRLPHRGESGWALRRDGDQPRHDDGRPDRLPPVELTQPQQPYGTPPGEESGFWLDEPPYDRD